LGPYPAIAKFLFHPKIAALELYPSASANKLTSFGSDVHMGFGKLEEYLATLFALIVEVVVVHLHVLIVFVKGLAVFYGDYEIRIHHSSRIVHRPSALVAIELKAVGLTHLVDGKELQGILGELIFLQPFTSVVGYFAAIDRWVGARHE
jgi:hypothetical protein